MNLGVRSLLFTKLSLFTNSSLLDKEENMKKGAGVYSLNISLNRGLLNRVLGVYHLDYVNYHEKGFIFRLI